MSGFRDFIRGFCVLLSDIAVCALALTLLRFLPDVGFVRLPLALWAAALAGVLAAGLILTARGISMNAYLIWNAVLTAGTAVLVWRGTQCGAYPGVIAGMAAICAACTAVHGAYLAWRLPGANMIVVYVDTLVVFLAFYLYTLLWSDAGAGHETAAFAAVTMVLDLFAVNRIRTDDDAGVIRGAGTASRLILLLIVLVILTLTGAVVGLASGQIHSLVDLLLWIGIRVGRIVGAILTLFATVIGWIIILLLILLPNTPKPLEENFQNMVAQNVEEIAETTGLTLPLWFWIALGAVLLAVFLAALFSALRGIRLNRVRRGVKRRRAVRKSHAFSAFLELAGRARAALAFEISYRRNRRTAGGLLVYADRLGKSVAARIENRGKTGKLRRDPAESPGAYFRRLAAYAQTNDAERLRGLAERMDLEYYGGGSARLTGEECRMYEEILRRCAAETKKGA